MIHGVCKALTLALAVTTAVGCRASAGVKAEVHSSQPEDEDVKWDEPAAAASSTAPAPAQDVALLGARHDLRLAGAGKSATCNCVAVVLGSANDPGIAWRSEVPQIDATSQLVVALSSEGLACANAPKDSLGASYWGYKQAGNDVIVVVEAAREGRPVTAGAIIPKPVGSGQVYLQPLSRSTPYGRPLTPGEHLCRLGNPGATNTSARAPVNAAPEPEPETTD